MRRRSIARLIAVLLPVILSMVSLALFLSRQLVADRLWEVQYDLLYPNTSGSGYTDLGFLFVSYGFAVLASLVVVLAALIRLGGRRWPWLALLLVTILPAVGFRNALSEVNLPRIAEEGQQIVQALEKYKAEQGEYPERLQELVPAYLASIPETGLVKERQFQYTRKGAQPATTHSLFSHLAKRFLADEPYVLGVPLVPRGNLIYRPSGDYRDINGSAAGRGWAFTLVD